MLPLMVARPRAWRTLAQCKFHRRPVSPSLLKILSAVKDCLTHKETLDTVFKHCDTHSAAPYRHVEMWRCSSSLSDACKLQTSLHAMLQRISQFCTHLCSNCDCARSVKLVMLRNCKSRMHVSHACDGIFRTWRKRSGRCSGKTCGTRKQK